MKKVLLRAPVLTQSGYGVHARQIASWLLSRKDIKLDIQALPWGDTPWLIDEKKCDGLIGKLMKSTVDPGNSSGRYDVTFQLQLPNEWDTRFSDVNVGMTAGVETDRCHPEWIAACNRMTRIVVPSTHVKNCLTSTGKVEKKLVVVPESYSKAMGETTRTHVDDLKFSTSFNFLIFGQVTGNNPENDRKNVFYAIKWLCETFKDDKDVGIVVKTNVGRNTHIDMKIVRQTFEALLKEVRVGQYPRLNILHGDMSDEEVSSLYRHESVKALVSPSRGEGYGLPLLEASVCGLPVIATRWSGHLDFLNQGKYIDVNYSLREIHPSRIDDRIFIRGTKWAHPIEEDFKKKVKKFRESPGTPKEWAVDLSKKLRSTLSQEAVNSLYDSELGDLF